MLRQYFTEMALREGETLSDGLQQLVNQAEEELGWEYVEVVQVVKHDSVHYTIILNLDLEETDSEEE